jgi:monothiol glutaredoxin
MPDIQETIAQILSKNPIVLFMKGTKNFPQCGFSHQVAHILSQEGVDFHDVNVLEDESMRQGIKDYTNWPTVPQLYIHGEFIGGCDIVRELHESGELRQYLSKVNV